MKNKEGEEGGGGATSCPFLNSLNNFAMRQRLLSIFL